MQEWEEFGAITRKNLADLDAARIDEAEMQRRMQPLVLYNVRAFCGAAAAPCVGC